MEISNRGIPIYHSNPMPPRHGKPVSPEGGKLELAELAKLAEPAADKLGQGSQGMDGSRQNCHARWGPSPSRTCGGQHSQANEGIAWHRGCYSHKANPTNAP